MKTIQLIEDLKEDLELLGFPLLVAQIDCIKTYYLSEIKALQPRPKKVITKKPKEQPLKCEITEAGKTTEVIFQTEKECETFLKLKQKHRLKTMQYPQGYTIPNVNSYGGSWADKMEKYKQKCEEYWQAAKDQNLDFNVVLTRC